VAERVLVVEDDDGVRKLLMECLRLGGFSVVAVGDAESARAFLAEADLLLLDWMLPGQSGLAFLKELRSSAQTRNLPVVILSARGAEVDRVLGLESGADDYVSKPFSPGELVARLRAVLRRRDAAPEGQMVTAGSLSVDINLRRVWTEKGSVTLSVTEFHLLHFLMTHPLRIFSREQLLKNVWDGRFDLNERTVDVHVGRLRVSLKAIGQENCIETERGEGYRFVTPHTDRSGAAAPPP
jgi:two-component system phosphate regulon response regulator PhoB